MKENMRTRLLGAFGEGCAAEYLRKNGYRLLAMNYRCGAGEIDIIAKKRRLAVFVEVKTRRSDSWADAAEYVDAAKQRRLRSAAEQWLEKYGREFRCGEECRFDVIEVYTDESERKVRKLNHITEAF
ncbi:MAG: YraN family protein [Oscillospiraceae bacterium]|nr:YraN family protein [Oscillospiraceae bacterium]